MSDVIIDTDPGIDDAVAILMLSKYFRLNIEDKIVAISTVSGNTNIDNVTKNACFLKDVCKYDVDIYRGSSEPLFLKNRFAEEAHGYNGLGGVDNSCNCNDYFQKGVLMLYKKIISCDNVIILALGPLTNIAKLMLLDKDIKKKIKKIIIMGGAYDCGNIEPFSEFNFYIDPHAAEIVLNSGVEIELLGLNIGRKAKLYSETLYEIKNKSKIGELIYNLLIKYDSKDIKNGVKMYDPSVSMCFMHPEIFKFKKANIMVSTNSDRTRGCSLVEFIETGRVKVCVDVNVEKFKKYIVDSI